MRLIEEDLKIRSLTKTFSWRAIATLVTISLAYLFTKQIFLAIGIGFADTIFKLFAYYFHERAWEKVQWGKRIYRK